MDRMEKYEKSRKQIPILEDTYSSKRLIPPSFSRKISLNASRHSKSGREYDEEDSYSHQKRVISNHLDKIENLDYSFLKD